MTPSVEVRGVGWRVAEREILHQVSVTVTSGEFVALLGRNGAGKSTLLDLIAGIRKPSDGEVLIAGRAMRDWPARELARTVAHLPQIVRGDVAFSAEELVVMGRYPHALGRNESVQDQEIVSAAMTRCGCAEFRTRRLATLSGGERQRVLLAACLAQQSRVLLLDEPATFLDIEQQLQCFRMLREEVERGAACLAVTHDINLALTFCSRLVVLDEGRVVTDLPVAAAVEQPAWLATFSPRLELAQTPAGRPWVYYA